MRAFVSKLHFAIKHSKQLKKEAFNAVISS